MTHLRADDGTLYEVVEGNLMVVWNDGLQTTDSDTAQCLIVRRVETGREVDDRLAGHGKGIQVERCRIVPGGRPGIRISGIEPPGGDDGSAARKDAVPREGGIPGSPSPPGTLDALVPRICTILAARGVEGPSLRVAIAEDIDSALAARHERLRECVASQQAEANVIGWALRAEDHRLGERALAVSDALRAALEPPR